MDQLDHFCGSEFWNSSVTWWTENPEFTSCFQRTVLLWFPCAFLWINSLFEIVYMKSSVNRFIPYGFLSGTKLLLTSALIAMSIIDISVVYSNEDNREMHPVDYYTPIIKIAAFILSAILLDFNRRFGMRTSGLQFLFWVFLLVCGVPQLRSQLKGKTERKSLGINDNYEEYNFISYLVFYVISFVIWALNCFADKAPLKTKYPKTEKPCPETEASFLSRIFFAWFDPLLWKGFKRPLKPDDLWDINPENSSKEIMPVFLKHWERSVAKANALSKKDEKKRLPSIASAIYKTFGSKFIFAFLMEFIRIILTIIPPQLLRLIIGFIDSTPSDSSLNGTDFSAVESNHRNPLWHGIFYAVLMFAVSSLQTITLYQNIQRKNLISCQAQTALVGAIYRKTLCLSNAARKESTMGEIVNLMVIDADILGLFLNVVDMIWSVPLQILFILYFLWDLLGVAAFAGLTIMIILMPLNSMISSKRKKVENDRMKTKDERIKLMNEILNGVKVLKMYAWEPSFVDQVLKIRGKEIRMLKKLLYLNAGTSFLWYCTPFLVALVSFATFVLSSDDNVLDAKTAFVSISFFNILGGALTLLPLLISSIIQAKVSVKRINRFMNGDELNPQNVTHDPSDASLSIENGTFSWSDGDPVLRNINLKVAKNKLVAVIGSVGAGKSSIISALLGETEKISGRVNTVGTIAYVSQQAWIQNATLQNNILFGKPMDRKQYDQVIAACALKHDLELLPSGDATEIGEKGVNLSGGQKQRVALARAVYSDADIYLLDDPLSSVDSHVGRHIFENVIGPNGILAKKTRLLVTHGITYLPNVDKIYVVKSGKIAESGTLSELIENKGEFADFYMKHLQDANGDDENLDEINDLEGRLDMDFDECDDQLSDTDVDAVLNEFEFRRRSSAKRRSKIVAKTIVATTKTNNQPKDNLIEKEKSEVGRVKWSVYMQCFKSVGVKVILLTIVLNLITHGFSIGTNMWLSNWSTDINVVNDTGARDMYLGVYAALGLGQAFAMIFSTILPRLGFLFAAINLHNALLNSITHAPMQFFDQTPVGRVLSRLSQDVGVLDSALPFSIFNCLTRFYELLSTLLVITFSTPIFLTVVGPLGVIYYFFQKFYIATSRQLKRFESVSKSPIYSHFGESIQGATTIRAFNVTDRFISESEQKVDNNQVFAIPSMIITSWLAVRLEVIGNLIILFAALFAVLNRDELDAGIVGFSISYALEISITLNWLIRHASAIETNMVSVERIKEYTETKQEGDWVNPNANVSKNWPEHGTVEFKNVDLRYRDGLDLALRNLTFTINASEKVGIVGRTGAGKSSLTLGLFRIIETASGSIVIDGQDISKLGLHTLRSKLTIIPQDPVLFSGSLRINLDPFDEKTDAEIWHALELAHLKSFVNETTSGLDHDVTEGGENLSVGQRQLICLARALLRKTKVLVLDEATAAIDLETDDLIQKTIRTEFKECTILTIAHRLNTIMDSDKVIVLDKGQVIEFDAPTELLKNENSVFYSMARDAGLL